MDITLSPSEPTPAKKRKLLMAEIKKIQQLKREAEHFPIMRKNLRMYQNQLNILQRELDELNKPKN